MSTRAGRADRRGLIGPALVTTLAVTLFGWDVARNEWSNRYYAVAGAANAAGDSDVG